MVNRLKAILEQFLSNQCTSYGIFTVVAVGLLATSQGISAEFRRRLLLLFVAERVLRCCHQPVQTVFLSEMDSTILRGPSSTDRENSRAWSHRILVLSAFLISVRSYDIRRIVTCDVSGFLQCVCADGSSRDPAVTRSLVCPRITVPIYLLRLVLLIVQLGRAYPPPEACTGLPDRGLVYIYLLSVQLRPSSDRLNEAC